jgi:CheY-like chemotaxis protein
MRVLPVISFTCTLARTHCSQTPVVVCTAHAQDQLLLAAVDLHGDDWLAVLELTMPERKTAELEDRRTELAAARVSTVL